MEKTKRICYIAFVILFAAAFLCSTQLVVNLYVGADKFKIDDLSIYQTNSRVAYAIDPVETYEDIKESLYISGWAFCETEADNPEKTITAILKGTDKIYSLAGEALMRRDVKAAFPDRKLPSMRFGIEVNASTLEVKDGIYDLYLHVWENEENYGLVRTGIKIKKDRNYFDIYQPQKVSVPDQEIIEDENVKYMVNVVDKDPNNAALEMDGFGFIEDVDTQECELYIVLLDDQNGRTFYETNMVNRLDVADYFQNERYACSGCSITIEDSQEAASAYAYTVAVKKDGIYHISPEITPLYIQEAVTWQSSVVTLEGHPAEEGTVKLSIDSINIQDGLASFKGWTFQPELDCNTQTVYLSIDGTTYTALSEFRGDVAKAYENDFYSKSGYDASIPISSIPEGEFAVQLVIENSGVLYSSAPIAIIRNGNEIQIKTS